MTQHVVLHYAPGPSWVTGRPIFEQALQPHLTYLTHLHKEGIVLAGGPYTDSSGGLVILQATTLEAAQDVIEGDPAIVAGILTACARPWHTVLNGLSTATRPAKD